MKLPSLWRTTSPARPTDLTFEDLIKDNISFWSEPAFPGLRASLQPLDARSVCLALPSTSLSLVIAPAKC